MAARSISRPIWRRGPGREAPPASSGTAATATEKIFSGGGNALWPRELTWHAGWRAPSPPTPHPSGERPWAAPVPGSSFLPCARFPKDMRHLERDPEKHALAKARVDTGFRKKICSSNNVERDDDSKISHSALECGSILRCARPDCAGVT